MSADMNHGSYRPLLRPMDLGQMLDQSFKVYRQAWKPLLTVGALSALPTILFTGVFGTLGSLDPTNPESSWVFRMAEQADAGDFTGLIAMFSGMGLGFLLMLLLYPLMQGAVVAICSHSFLGRPVTAGEALRAALQRYFPLLGTIVLVGLIMVVSVPLAALVGLLIFAILTIPAAMAALGTYLAFTTHVVMVEGTGGGPAAISRSFKLVSGRFWPLLGTGVVFVLLTSVVNGFGSFVGMIIGFIQLATGPSAILNWVTALVGGGLSAVTMPFLMVGLTLAYYDTRIRKEGFDLEMLAQSQLSQPPQQPL